MGPESWLAGQKLVNRPFIANRPVQECEAAVIAIAKFDQLLEPLVFLNAPPVEDEIREAAPLAGPFL